MKKSQALKEKHVTDLKIKKLTVRSGVKAAMGCNPCHTPHDGLALIGSNALNVSALAGVSALKIG
ncbi:MAG TPA: hypothetical protein VHM70_00845 [Polyangiaceae bacterium]|jgi:hypothetical protein|nr:hypothetical protein [Polyangiaceae bacterium]